MNWHYVNQGQQAGPVTEAELLTLIRAGKISEETLVWREGMANWVPFHQAGIPSAAPGAPPPFQTATSTNPNEVVCAECGKIFPIDETIPYGNTRVCAACKPIFLQKLAEGAKVETGQFEYAGFGIRLGAWLLDGLILGIPYMVIVFVIFGTLGVFSAASRQESTPANPLAPFLMLLMQLGVLVIQVGYWTFFIGKFGATPGKMACKLKVVRSDGSPVSYGRAFGRAFAQILSAWMCYIGYFMVLFDSQQRRALHDHICDTRVVRK